MEIALVIVVIAALAYLLHRDDRRHWADGRYWGQSLDRDYQRVRADLLAAPDGGRRPERHETPAASDWEPRA